MILLVVTNLTYIMSQPLLVKGARQLLTLRDTASSPAGPRRGAKLSDLGIIEDGAVLISNGTIQSVGPTRRLENLAQTRDVRIIDATGKVVMPGFIDSDCRLLPSDPPLWKKSSVAKKSLEVSRRKISQVTACGTLAMESQAGPMADYARELRQLQANRQLSLSNPNLISTYVPERVYDAQLPKLLKKELFQFIEIPSSATEFNKEETRSWMEHAAGLGCLMKIRTSAMSNCRNLPVQQVCWEGDASIDEIDWAANQSWVLLGMPLESLRQDHSGKQWREMVDAGVALALATGADCGLGGAASMQLVVSLACAQMGLSIEEAITATTMNAAHAMGIQEVTGSLEPGKRADLLILDVPDYREIPYHLGINLVSKVILHGEILFQQLEPQWLGE